MDRPAGGGTYIVLTLISLYCIIPFIWLVLASVDGNASSFLHWPRVWTAAHYTAIASGYPLLWVCNSLLVSCLSTALVIVLGGLGGYALSRIDAWWKAPFLYAIILIRVVPPTALLVPLYKVMLTGNAGVGALVRRIVPPDFQQLAMHIFGLVDGYLGLILILTSAQLPLALWIIKTFFDTIPREYEEAALLDGATSGQRIRRVLVPLAMPGLAAAALFAFINAWGDFLTPLIFVQSPELQMLPTGIFRAFLTDTRIDYGSVAAQGVVYLLPAALAFMFARRFLILTFSGGVKG